ncbi:hypothetical protein Mpe_B0581 (plasmid) [Methylibium petroleiphilum PM1]|uniref:Uncharacterized protein n=1 Tax=Methylibium petroleiphilum (strain ATCC BAA-1232 / LMG 22953 / PM1) TaxID=420662 RepID=A2SP58_METPP|nr:hypothetical protein Mpe_B0581 [Methylibium petroleiphilum PM1]
MAPPWCPAGCTSRPTSLPAGSDDPTLRVPKQMAPYKRVCRMVVSELPRAHTNVDTPAYRTAGGHRRLNRRSREEEEINTVTVLQPELAADHKHAHVTQRICRGTASDADHRTLRICPPQRYARHWRVPGHQRSH